MIIGGIFLFLASLLYWQSGGIGKRILEPERYDKIERYYAASYNRENELELERSRMRLYRERKTGFIHSDLTIAVKVARTFEKRTLHDEIEDCELRIAILEDLLKKNGETG